MHSSTNDPYNLQRFLNAQDSTYEQARAELSAGRKRSHWMWFIFHQIRGLGSSAMAQRFAIGDLKEAKAYLEHDVLGDFVSAPHWFLQFRTHLPPTFLTTRTT